MMNRVITIVQILEIWKAGNPTRDYSIVCHPFAHDVDRMPNQVDILAQAEDGSVGELNLNLGQDIDEVTSMLVSIGGARTPRGGRVTLARK